jgi:hypothetical protein
MRAEELVEAKVLAWDDGYQSGVEDASECTHGRGMWRGLNSTLNRWCWKLTGGRWSIPLAGQCRLYRTPNPYELDEVEETGNDSE